MDNDNKPNGIEIEVTSQETGQVVKRIFISYFEFAAGALIFLLSLIVIAKACGA